jgi:hypothetical protein
MEEEVAKYLYAVYFTPELNFYTYELALWHFLLSKTFHSNTELIRADKIFKNKIGNSFSDEVVY